MWRRATLVTAAVAWILATFVGVVAQNRVASREGCGASAAAGQTAGAVAPATVLVRCADRGPP